MNEEFDPTTAAMDSLEAEYDTYAKGCVAEGFIPLPFDVYVKDMRTLNFTCSLTAF